MRSGSEALTAQPALRLTWGPSWGVQSQHAQSRASRLAPVAARVCPSRSRAAAAPGPMSLRRVACPSPPAVPPRRRCKPAPPPAAGPGLYLSGLAPDSPTEVTVLAWGGLDITGPARPISQVSFRPGPRHLHTVQPPPRLNTPASGPPALPAAPQQQPGARRWRGGPCQLPALAGPRWFAE